MVARESGLEAELDAYAGRCERHVVRIVVDQRVDVRLGGRDPLGFGEDPRFGHEIRSMIVPVDSAPPAHIVISAVLWSVRSNS